MSADRLSALLSEGGLAPANVRQMADLCEEWFEAEPSLAPFVLRSIFLELSQLRGWDDEQGVARAQHDVFKDRLLPALSFLVDMMPAVPADALAGGLNDLVRTFQECRVVARQA